MYIHVKCKHVCRKKNIVNVLSGLVHGLTSILSHNVPPPMCAGVRVNLSQYLNVSFAVVFFFLPPAHLKHIQPPSTTFVFYTGACLPH